jgi:hypothetical protein
MDHAAVRAMNRFMHRSNSPSFHLVRTGEQCQRHIQTERLGGLQVDRRPLMAQSRHSVVVIFERAGWNGSSACRRAKHLKRRPDRRNKVKWVQQKYSTLPKFGFVVCRSHLTRSEGWIASRPIRGWVAVDAGSVGTRSRSQGGPFGS